MILDEQWEPSGQQDTSKKLSPPQAGPHANSHPVVATTSIIYMVTTDVQQRPIGTVNTLFLPLRETVCQNLHGAATGLACDFRPKYVTHLRVPSKSSFNSSRVFF